MAENAKEREATASGGGEESAAPERKCAWRSDRLPKYQCKGPVSEVGQLCILHSDDAEKNREEFRAKLEEKKKAGDFDFRGTFFPEAVWFTGELKQANFSEVTFQGQADFSHATFLGQADFLQATFQGAANFSRARFQGAAHFLEATFQGAAYFSVARFQGDANFRGARFQGAAFFISSRFETEARFRWTQFRKEVSFVRSRFAGKAHLEQIYLSGTVKFEEAEFGSAVFFRGPFYAAPTDEEEKEKGARAEARRQPIPPKLGFENVLLEEPGKARFEGLDLRKTTFAGTNVRQI